MMGWKQAHYYLLLWMEEGLGFWQALESVVCWEGSPVYSPQLSGGSSRALEGRPKPGPPLPPPVVSGGTRALAGSRWGGLPGWVPQCAIPRP